MVAPLHFPGGSAVAILVAAWTDFPATGIIPLVRDLQQAMQKHMTTEKLRILLYSKGLAAEDEAKIREADAGEAR